MFVHQNWTLFSYFTFAHIFYSKKLNAKVNKRVLYDIDYKIGKRAMVAKKKKEYTNSGCDSIGLFAGEFSLQLEIWIYLYESESES